MMKDGVLWLKSLELHKVFPALFIPLLVYMAWYDFRKKRVPGWAIYPSLLAVVLQRGVEEPIVLLYALVFVLGDLVKRQLLFLLFPLALLSRSFMLFIWTFFIYFYHFLGGGRIGGGDMLVLILLTGLFPEVKFVLLLAASMLLYSLPRLFELYRRGGLLYIYCCLHQDLTASPSEEEENIRPCVWVYSLSGIIYFLWKLCSR